MDQSAGFVMSLLLAAAITLELVLGLNDGLAQTPPQAWTSWNLCRFEVNATLIKETALALESTGLKALGWDTLQIDEGWEACEEYNRPQPGLGGATCKVQTPRDAQGRIVANRTKFPGGIKPLADWLHAKGFKIGIYTSASQSACGGNWGSRGHETTDAEAFAAWGIDWVKVDNCDYGSWGDLIASQRVMSAALQAAKRPMIIQIGAGDHMPLLNNPNATTSQVPTSYARSFDEQAWVWGAEIVHTWYTGNDMHNYWASTVSNILHNYRGAQYFQKPGAWNFAGDLWCGTTEQPGNKTMSLVEEQSTYALFMIMASPPMLGCDIRRLSTETLAYLSNTELLAVNQDAWGIQGSIVDMGDGSQVFAKPLSDGSFAFALWNLGAQAANVSVSWGTLAPQFFRAMAVRDIWARKDMGVHEGGYSAVVPGHGVAIIKATPDKRKAERDL